MRQYVQLFFVLKKCSKRNQMIKAFLFDLQTQRNIRNNTREQTSKQHQHRAAKVNKNSVNRGFGEKHQSAGRRRSVT